MTINKNYIDYLKSDIDFTRQYYIKKYNNLGLEMQTNQYIQNRMNILVSYLKNHKNIKYIILDYKDDMLSYINYSIVSNCFQFLNNNYKLLFFGKIKKTKDYIYNYKQSAAVLRRKVRKAPQIAHAHRAAGRRQNKAELSGEITCFFLHSPIHSSVKYLLYPKSQTAALFEYIRISILL